MPSSLSVDIAHAFAKSGYYVFPLYRGKNNQKLKPFGWAINEVLDPNKIDKVIPATNQPDEVKTWPDQVKTKYNSEVNGFGILGLNCVIIDVDVKGGKPGINEFKTLMEKFHIPKPPMFTISKSGGIHAFYKRPDGFRDSYIKTIAGVSIENKRFTAVDLRGNGGFVVGPDRLVTDHTNKKPGEYITKGLSDISSLPEFPAKLLQGWIRTQIQSDVDNLISLAPTEVDYKTQIRRGLIPDHVPKGARNESFYLLANVLRSKGVPITVAKQMCTLMAEKVEEPESLDASVDIEAILARAYVIHKDSPYDVAVDMINHGFFQLTNHKPKLHYVILENNPYLKSRAAHDESSMKTLLIKFQKSVLLESGKSKLVNPMDIIVKIMHDENRVDTLGFLPNAGQVFCMNDDPGSKRFLNTYQPMPAFDEDFKYDVSIWDEFKLLITRLFGEEGSEEYQLGLDFSAWMVQRPQDKLSIAPFIMSYNRGVGKSLFFNVLIHILGVSKDGERQGRLTKLDELSGRFFNPAGCILNMIDEVQFPIHKDMRKESVTFWRHMKNLITAETVSVEIKGGNTFQAPNTAALILAGNSGGNFPIEEMDRRLWMIDNNPPVLQMGEVDRLFQLIKRTTVGTDIRVNFVDSLRYMLHNHEIKIDLSSVRAPMSAIKREMFINSLTDVEEWFVGHFEDVDNLFAHTPVISKSALLYVIETAEPMRTSRWAEDTEKLWRDLKRRSFIRPIRCKGNNKLSRQFTVPVIGNDGKLFEAKKREILYTTKLHGEYDDLETKDVMYAYMQNTHTIKYFKGQIKGNVREILTDLGENNA